MRNARDEGRGMRGSSWRRVALALSLTAVAGCADIVGPAWVPGPGDTSVPDANFMSMVNEHRASVGCGPLAWHDGAALAAQRHAWDMATRGYFSHVTPEGNTLSDRLADAGVAYSYAGENIAAGQESTREVFEAWLRSSGHRENLETCEFTHHGLGREGNHWTHVMIVPR